jgi:hypothetical protein
VRLERINARRDAATAVGWAVVLAAVLWLVL